jgi:hypothetical protein
VLHLADYGHAHRGRRAYRSCMSRLGQLFTALSETPDTWRRSIFSQTIGRLQATYPNNNPMTEQLNQLYVSALSARVIMLSEHGEALTLCAHSCTALRAQMDTRGRVQSKKTVSCYHRGRKATSPVTAGRRHHSPGLILPRRQLENLYLHSRHRNPAVRLPYLVEATSGSSTVGQCIMLPYKLVGFHLQIHCSGEWRALKATVTGDVAAIFNDA